MYVLYLFNRELDNGTTSTLRSSRHPGMEKKFSALSHWHVTRDLLLSRSFWCWFAPAEKPRPRKPRERGVPPGHGTLPPPAAAASFAGGGGTEEREREKTRMGAELAPRESRSSASGSVDPGPDIGALRSYASRSWLSNSGFGT